MMQRTVSDKRQKMLIAAFFVLLTLVGLWMGMDYGVPWDEASEQRILAQNFHEYAYQILGKDSSFIQGALAKGATLISQNIERDHGVAPYYPIVPIFMIKDAHLVTRIWQGYTWLVFMLGVVSLYFLVRALGANRPTAALASLLLYLSPRFFAEGHYNNKDVVLLALVLCIFALAARLMQTRSYPGAIALSLAGAFAANVKIIGIVFWGLACLATLWKWLLGGKLSKRDYGIILVTILSFLAGYFLLTPAMWNNPGDFFRYLIDNMTHFSRWDGYVLFEGIQYRPAQALTLPWYYLPKMILLTVPVPYLLLALAGQIFAIGAIVKDKQSRALLTALSLLWLLPLAYAMVRRPVVYNGWRHFYFIYASFAALGGYALVRLWALFSERRARRILYTAAACFVFATQAVVIAAGHPFQYVYFNVLASRVEENYELDYWALSTYSALQELLASKERNQDLPLLLAKPETSEFLYPVTNNIVALPPQKRARIEYTTEIQGTPYLIYNTTYAKIEGFGDPPGYHKLISIQGYGRELVSIFEIDKQ